MKKNQKLIEAEIKASYFFLIIFNKGPLLYLRGKFHLLDIVGSLQNSTRY